MKTPVQFICVAVIVHFLLGGVMRSAAQSFITNGLVAYYPFNGNANDASGNGNNGTVAGATLTTDRFGVPNSAYSFNGSNSYIYVPSSGSLQLTNDFTITSWIYFTGSGPNFFDVVTKHRRNVNNQGTWIESIDGNIFDFEATPYFDASGQLQPPVRTGLWHQYVVTYSLSSRIWSVYLDGVVVASATRFYNIQITPYNLAIGAENDPGSNPPYANFFKGSLDDIRLYNRALSADEVAQLFANETPFLVDLIRAVKPAFSSLSVGTNYQMQISSDLIGWTDQGAVFTATNTYMVYPQYFEVGNWGDLYFRLQVAP